MTKEQSEEFAEDVQRLVQKYSLRTFAFVMMYGATDISIRCNAGCAGTDEKIQNNFKPCGDQMIAALLAHLASNGVIKQMGRG